VPSPSSPLTAKIQERIAALGSLLGRVGQRRLSRCWFVASDTQSREVDREALGRQIVGAYALEQHHQGMLESGFPRALSR
jgi:hypothetical protein